MLADSVFDAESFIDAQPQNNRQHKRIAKKDTINSLSQ